MKSRIAFLLFAFAVLFLIGSCSSGTSPITSDSASSPVISDYSNIDALGILGAYELTLDPENQTAELVAKRAATLGESYLVSGLSFFTMTPCSNCFKIAGIGLDTYGNLQLTFYIKHPFNPANHALPEKANNRDDLNIFDVALVVVPTANATPTYFPLLNRNIYAGLCANPDIYTRELRYLVDDDAGMPYFLVVDETDTVPTPTKWNVFSQGVESFFDITFNISLSGLKFDLYLTMGYGAAAKKATFFTPRYLNPEFNRKAAWKVVVTPPDPCLGWVEGDTTTPHNVMVEVYDWQIGATVNPDLTNLTDVWAASEVASVSVEVLGGMGTALTPVAPATGRPGDPLVYAVPIANEGDYPIGAYMGLAMVLDTRVPQDPSQTGSTRDFLIHTDDGEQLDNYKMIEFASYQTFIANVNPPQFSYTLEQVDWTLDQISVPDSAFGSIQLEWVPPVLPTYFNLSVNGNWVIRNIPLIPIQGVGVSQSVTMGFPLGTPNGVNVTSANSGASIDDVPRSSPPPESGPTPVEDRPVDIGSGRNTGGVTVPNPQQEFGGQLESPESWAVHGDAFPNQDCGNMECGPAGVSNSLQWLQNKYGTPPSTKPVDIGTMKTATGWIQPDPPTEPGGIYTGWADVKNNYMNSNGYGVTTTQIPHPDNAAHRATAAECDQAMQAIREGKDVELNGEKHVAAVVGMAKLADGRYVMYVAHDTEQDEPGGTRIEKVIYDPNNPSAVAEGGWCLDGMRLNGFVVEGV